MIQVISEGILVTTEVIYKNEVLDNAPGEYLFICKIGLKNLLRHRIKLLSKSLFLLGSSLIYQPIDKSNLSNLNIDLDSFEEYNYTLSILLFTHLGIIKGSFKFKDPTTNRVNRITLPKMDLIVPHKNN